MRRSQMNDLQLAICSVFDRLCGVNKRLCCVCEQKLGDYTYSEHKHPYFSSKKFRVHAGKCRHALTTLGAERDRDVLRP